MLTITTTRAPATDLGYLLHKHPDRVQQFDLPFGQAHVLYPEATEERCTAALLLDIDPIKLTKRGQSRNQRGTPDFLLQEYVNDRPYAASSHLSVALTRVYSSALSGVCQAQPELVNQPLPLSIGITSLRCPVGEELLRRIFEPLDYTVTVETPGLDERYPHWGESVHHNVTLESDKHTLSQTLKHLYLLLPVVDNSKHYWIDDSELEKMFRIGEGWLEQHPGRRQIARRYLGHRNSLLNEAEERFKKLDEDAGSDNAGVAAETVLPGLDLPAIEATIDQTGDAMGEEPPDPEQETATPRLKRGRDYRNLEARLEAPLTLGDQRMAAVLDAVKTCSAKTVLDLGCGEGQLLRPLCQTPELEKVTGVEVSPFTLTRCKGRLKMREYVPEWLSHLTLLQGSLVYRDRRLNGYDCAVAMEVIEHIDESRLPAFEDAILGAARPKTLIITTPNREFNRLFPDFDYEKDKRHRDHRFEWTREQFQEWCSQAANNQGYSVAISPIGNEHPEYGGGSQMAVFTRLD